MNSALKLLLASIPPTLADAIIKFAQIKQLPPDELIKLFRVK